MWALSRIHPLGLYLSKILATVSTNYAENMKQAFKSTRALEVSLWSSVPFFKAKMEA